MPRMSAAVAEPGVEGPACHCCCCWPHCGCWPHCWPCGCCHDGWSCCGCCHDGPPCWGCSPSGSPCCGCCHCGCCHCGGSFSSSPGPVLLMRETLLEHSR